MLFLKVTYLTCGFLTILCGNVFSQSIFLDVNNLNPVATYQFAHGFGVSPLNSYDSSSSYEQACDLALEELNSNKFMSVFIEHFKTDSYTDYAFPELSITDTTLNYGKQIVKADSFEVAGQAFCIASPTDDSIPAFLQIPDLEKLKVAPIKQDGYWFVMGTEKASKYNPYNQWVKSKNAALKDLTKTISTQIQSRTLGVNYTFAEFTYIKSYVIFRNIIVAQRYVSEANQFVSVVAVHEDDVTAVN